MPISFACSHSAFLIAGMHEDARHLRIGGRAPDELHLHGGENGGIDGERILQHRYRGHVLALLRGQDAVGHGGEPDIGVEPHLMAGMAGQHRPAARLRHVADKQPRPAVERARVAREPLEIIEELRGAPIAVAREPHDLPVGAVDGERDTAGETAFGVGADRARGEGSRASSPRRTARAPEAAWAGLSWAPAWRRASLEQASLQPSWRGRSSPARRRPPHKTASERGSRSAFASALDPPSPGPRAATPRPRP